MLDTIAARVFKWSQRLAEAPNQKEKMTTSNRTGKAQATAATSQTTTKKGATRKPLLVTIKPATATERKAAAARLEAAVEARNVKVPRQNLLTQLGAGATFRPMPLAAISNKALRALCVANGATLLTLLPEANEAKQDRSTILKGWFGEGNEMRPRGYLGTDIEDKTDDNGNVTRKGSKAISPTICAAWSLSNLVWIDTRDASGERTVQVFATHPDAPTPQV